MNGEKRKAWSTIKRSYKFRKRVKNEVNSILIGMQSLQNVLQQSEPLCNTNVSMDSQSEQLSENTAFLSDSDCISPNHSVQATGVSDDDSAWNQQLDEHEENNIDIAEEFRYKLKEWAIEFKPTMLQLKGLLSICNSTLNFELPCDPRTLLGTPTVVKITRLADYEQYWHNGLRAALDFCLRSIPVQDLPNHIALNVNVDGIRPFKSSNAELWPILFNVHGMKHIKPKVIGIFAGNKKPSSLDYLKPFVEEVLDIIENGYAINNHYMSLSIRCIIGDTPARAHLRGVVGHTSSHGCGRCTTVGRWNSNTRKVVFPDLNAEKRNDENFRRKGYGLHQKCDTPLTQLPIDMVADFVIGDMLHLIDLGIMKRLLDGYRFGTLTNIHAKWSKNDKIKINKYLSVVKGPKEIRSQRAIRTLDDITHWKGREYRVFLLYLSLPIFNFFLKPHLFEHYLLFYCGITIFSNKHYVDTFLNTGDLCIQHYLKDFKTLYGIEHFSSNLHNLSHLIDDVKRFGPLDSFSAYPFESSLCQIKRLLKTGSSPLAQIAKRLTEHQNQDPEKLKIIQEGPTFKKKIECNELLDEIANCIYMFVNDSQYCVYNIVNFDNFTIDCRYDDDKWVILKKNTIFKIYCIISLINKNIYFCGKRLLNAKDLFVLPICSKRILIYESENCMFLDHFEIISVKDVSCKLFKLPKISENEDEEIVVSSTKSIFVPILHTVDI